MERAAIARYYGGVARQIATAKMMPPKPAAPNAMEALQEAERNGDTARAEKLRSAIACVVGFEENPYDYTEEQIYRRVEPH